MPRSEVLPPDPARGKEILALPGPADPVKDLTSSTATKEGFSPTSLAVGLRALEARLMLVLWF